MTPQSYQLVYSYSHKDSLYRESMEKSLSLLERDGLLDGWSDQAILPGQQISDVVRAKLDNADIIVFLLSQDFIASDECTKEWKYATELARDNKALFRIPIIVRDCAWKELLGNDDIKALPYDGYPIAKFEDSDTAWQQVYEGLKEVVDRLRSTFTAKSEFKKELEKTEFLSQENINLQDLFVFLHLASHGSQKPESERDEEPVRDIAGLLSKQYTLIHGPDTCGKTALGRYVFLKLVEESRPVLYVDLRQVQQKANDKFFSQTYRTQFNGDYSLWREQSDKTLIIDNLSGHPMLIDFVESAKDFFDRIIVTLSSDVFDAFFRDEHRLADFEELTICPLTQVQQEALIRKRLSLSNDGRPVEDGYVDQVENRVNSIIISNKIVPRYPFFVLCILQTYEAYMPSGLTITSYGHCYYALIVASLVRAGISHRDSDINVCFNFAENLAFEIHRHKSQGHDTRFDFEGFVRDYRQNFIITNSTLNRLKNAEFGPITENGDFRTTYMYHFFLGRFLAKESPENKAILERICDAPHVSANYLTLIFTIHHTTNYQLIDEILIRTMYSLDRVGPARLERDETRIFEDIVDMIPESVLSDGNIEAAREHERLERDDSLDHSVDTYDDVSSDDDQTEMMEVVNDCYRVLRNNEIMGQILRNKYGVMPRGKIEEIVEELSDSGLRVVNLVLKDSDQISEMARYIIAKNPEYDLEEIKRALQAFSFIWTMGNIERIVHAVNIPEIRQSIDEVVKRAGAPAYDLVGYFALLDSSTTLGDHEKEELARLLKKHRNHRFVKRVLSTRTQRYMNTHRSKAQVEQAICSLLEIKYIPRLIRPQ